MRDKKVIEFLKDSDIEPKVHKINQEIKVKRNIPSRISEEKEESILARYYRKKTSEIDNI